MILRDVHEQLKSNKVSPSRSIFSQVSLAPPRITASQRELKLNKVSPLRSKTVLKSFLPPREMVNVPEATAFCNIVNVPEDRSRRNQCISDAKPKCAQTAAEETNAFPMQNPNVHKLQPKKPMHFRCKPKCAQTAAEETNAFCRDQVCRTAAEETNAFQMCKFFRVHGKAQDYQDAL